MPRASHGSKTRRGAPSVRGEAPRRRRARTRCSRFEARRCPLKPRRRGAALEALRAALEAALRAALEEALEAALREPALEAADRAGSPRCLSRCGGGGVVGPRARDTREATLAPLHCLLRPRHHAPSPLEPDRREERGEEEWPGIGAAGRGAPPRRRERRRQVDPAACGGGRVAAAGGRGGAELRRAAFLPHAGRERLLHELSPHSYISPHLPVSPHIPPYLPIDCPRSPEITRDHPRLTEIDRD